MRTFHPAQHHPTQGQVTDAYYSGQDDDLKGVDQSQLVALAAQTNNQLAQSFAQLGGSTDVAALGAQKDVTQRTQAIGIAAALLQSRDEQTRSAVESLQKA
ncbi:MAG: hypothetical protein HY791_26230 [Deltaproteobacteria bacterium]|nr:hypothetical protein [Deltaproteobacteria bacterium]